MWEIVKKPLLMRIKNPHQNKPTKVVEQKDLAQFKSLKKKMSLQIDLKVSENERFPSVKAKLQRIAKLLK